MGRHAKKVISEEGIDRRQTGYYSTPKQIEQYLYSTMTSIYPDGKKVLDPCVGKEELISSFLENGFEIDSFDVVTHKKHYLSNFQETDFLKYYLDIKDKGSLFHETFLDYDFYIANPPYNCHEDEYIRKNKSHLEKHFKVVGTLNMYSMFIYALLDLAKDGSIIGLITMDSFLTSFYHANLRKFILESSTIHQLLLCPTDLFLDQNADVRTCLIVLQKGKPFEGKIKINNRDTNKSIFFNKLEHEAFPEANLSDITLKSEKDNSEIVLEVPTDIRSLFDYKRLGDLFHCVTGISTGNDSLYLSKTKTPEYNVPFYKNPGSRKFFTEPDCFLISEFLEISKSISNFMVRNKRFIGQEGITCSSMGIPFSAAYLPANSAFGVNANIFPEDSNDIWWLIAYLNSSLSTYIVRSVLLRTNMITSGYVSRLPIADLSKDIKSNLEQLSREGYELKKKSHSIEPIIKEIDSIIFKNLSISESTIRQIYQFNQELLKSV